MSKARNIRYKYCNQCNILIQERKNNVWTNMSPIVQSKMKYNC